MSRLPVPGSDKGTWGDVLNDFLSVEHDADGTLKASGSLASKASNAAVVHNSGDEAVGGIKTFSASPVVPTPTTGTQAANKAYVDTTAAAGAPDASTSVKGLVQLTGDLAGTATAPSVPGLTGKTDKSTLTAKGDIYAASAASTPARLPVGTNGHVLTADSAQTTGVKWAAATATDSTAVHKGDLVLNVKDYGALGNNSADDTAAIQLALDAGTNATVVFPAGVYLIGAPLVVPNDCRLLGLAVPGDQPSNTGAIIKQKNGANMADGLLVTKKWWNSTSAIDKHIEIENLVIDANVANNGSSTACGIIFVGMFGVIKNVAIRNTPSHGLLLPGTYRNSSPVVGTAVENVFVQLRISGCGGSGLAVTDTGWIYTDGTLRDSWISTIAGTAAVDVAHSAGWIVDNVHTYGTQQHGIRLRGANSTRCTNNYIEPVGSAHGATTYYGVYVEADGINNTVIGNSIGLDDASNGTFRAIGVVSMSNGSSAIITGNGLRGLNGTARNYGIFMDASSATLTVREAANDFYGISSENRYVRAGAPSVYNTAIDPAPTVRTLPATWYVSHRGGGSMQGTYQGPFPEETIEAFEASITLGTIHALNPHVRMLADNTLVCMHDTTPDRTTNVAAISLPAAVATAAWNAAGWRRLKVTPSNATLWPGYGVDWGEQHPPTFGEYLRRVGSRSVHVIECVSAGTSAQPNGTVGTAVVNELRARGLQDSAIIQSFSVSELTPAANAGITTMYLPPDLGTGGSDAASITTAMASGWAIGTTKWVGINAFPTGQTQAQMVTYIGTLTAAGFKVAVYTVVRRYDRDWLAAAGVTCFITDEPLYLPATTAAAVNSAGVSPVRFGTAPHGWLPADRNFGRGKINTDGIQLDYATGTAATQYVAVGDLSVPPSLTAYTLQADFVWDQLDTDATRHADIIFCCPDDRRNTFVIGSGNGVVDGYQLFYRQNAGTLGMVYGTQSSQTISSNILNQTTGLPPAPSAATVTTFKIQVTSTQLIVTLIQSSTTYGPFTVTDNRYRGGYWHLGKAFSSNATKLIGTWKNISLT